MRLIASRYLWLLTTSLLCTAAASGQSADVILGELDRTILYPEGDTVFVAAGTISCNSGSGPLNWYRLPDNRHPVIALNLYRLLDGRMEQIGQSWLKHGLTALEHNVCGFGCQQTHAGSRLGPGCSDPYGAGMNRGPNLGSRREVNPVTGHFEGATANDHSNHQHTSDLEHSLQVGRTDLEAPGAQFFIEGHYVAADDAVSGSGFNNVSHRRLSLERRPDGTLVFNNDGLTRKYQPAILSWPGATYQNVYSVEASVDGVALRSRVILAAKVEQTGGRRHRYDYAVFNLNSERGIAAFKVPVGGLAVSNVGASAVASFGDGLSNDEWETTIENGYVTWATERFADNENANAIRWGTTYNFWFEASSPPTVGEVVLTKFKPGDGPDEVAVMIAAPISKP